jgi:hypothetical protein
MAQADTKPQGGGSPVLARLQVPDGKDYPDITIRWDERRQELVLYTDRLRGELYLVIIDGAGIDHHPHGWT